MRTQPKRGNNEGNMRDYSRIFPEKPEECKVGCIQEVKHTHKSSTAAEEDGRVVLPSRRQLPPFLEKLLERKT